MSRVPALRIVSLWAAIFVTAGCSVSTGGPEAASNQASLVLSVAGGVAIDEVSYVISGNGMEPMTGVIETTAPGATASVEVYGLPPGTGYELVMTAMPVGSDVTCEGRATFDVEAGQSTEVSVYLNCKAPPQAGGVRVDGKFNLCANLEEVVVAPLQTSLDHRIDLSAEATDADGDAIAYAWLASAGEIDDPEAPTTHYTCTEAGDHAIAITVSDDPPCLDSWTVHVSCIEGPPPARTWSEPEPLEDSDKGASNPQVAVDDANNAVVVWEQPDNGFFSIRANRYLSGTGWGAAETIEDSDTGASDPRVVIDAQGNATAVWEQSAVWAARLTPAAGWGVPEIISAGTGIRIGPLDLAVDSSGAVWAVWGQFGVVGGSFGRYDVWTNRYDPVKGWGDAQSLEEDDTSTARDSRVAVDAAGNGLAIWLQSGHLWSCVYAPGLGWGSPEVAVQDGQGVGAASYAELTLDDSGHAVVVWSRDGGANPGFGNDVWAAHYTMGEGWDAPEMLDADELRDANKPDLARDAGGNAIAVWIETEPPGSTNQISTLWARRYVPSTGWGAATRLDEDSTGQRRNPSVAVSSSGSAIVVWTQDMSPPASVWARHYDPTLGWRPRVQIGNGEALRVSKPQVAIDAFGRATAVWEQWLPNETGSTTPSIWASRFE
ncbi:MAG: hypothetical protein PVI24_12890 [Myxococcales bacterium]|jgi:hypothetical protein